MVLLRKKLCCWNKTTNVKNYQNWVKFSPPIKYIKQTQLYAYLMNATKFSIVGLFLEDEDYEHPELLNISKRHLKNFDFSLNITQAKDDIQKALDWYEKYTSLGKSPKWNEMLDADFLEFVACHNEEEWKNLFLKWAYEGKVSLHDE